MSWIVLAILAWVALCAFFLCLLAVAGRADRLTESTTEAMPGGHRRRRFWRAEADERAGDHLKSR